MRWTQKMVELRIDEAYKAGMNRAAEIAESKVSGKDLGVNLLCNNIARKIADAIRKEAEK